MLVTSYYDIYGNPERFSYYMSLFDKLGNSEIPIILFTDPSLVEHFADFPSSVRVIGMAIETFELYSMAINYNGPLPASRNTTKDTKEFLALMNTKIEFVLKASELVAATPEETFIWIDFGILKIIKDVDRFINKLKSVNETTYNKIIIPGCWTPEKYFSVDHVNWRFCGGLFVIPRNHIRTFYDHSKNVLNDFCTLPQYKLTWETNIWNIIEICAAKDIIQWFSADHNDTILLNIDTVNNS
jgi:hypothetical protein